MMPCDDGVDDVLADLGLLRGPRLLMLDREFPVNLLGETVKSKARIVELPEQLKPPLDISTINRLVGEGLAQQLVKQPRIGQKFLDDLGRHRVNGISRRSQRASLHPRSLGCSRGHLVAARLL